MSGRGGLRGFVGWERSSILDVSWDAVRVRDANRIDGFLLTSEAFPPLAFHSGRGVQRIPRAAHLCTLTSGRVPLLTLSPLLLAIVPKPTALPLPLGLESSHWLLQSPQDAFEDG